MKKALGIIKTTLLCIIVAVAVFMMVFTLVSVSIFDRTDRDLFGYKAFIVLSDSMSATDFSSGDLVLVKEVKDPSTLKEGDIIAYQSTNIENYGEIVTHKIRELTLDDEGKPGFITYGTTTNTNDEDIVTYSLIIGKYQKRIAGVGTFFRFLKTTPGYIICIFLPFLLLIIAQGVNSIYLFRRYRQEQMAELKAEQEEHMAQVAQEREQLKVEREESQRIMDELMKLKEQLSNIEEKDQNITDDYIENTNMDNHADTANNKED